MGTKTNYKTDFSKIFKPLKTAVLVDLSFFLKRYKTQFNVSNSEDIAKRLRHYI